MSTPTGVSEGARAAERGVGRAHARRRRLDPIRRVSISDILELTTAERAQIVQEIWENVVNQPETVPVTEAQKREIDRRLEAIEKNPELGDSWENTRNALPDK